MKSKRSLKEMSKVPLIKYLRADLRNQVVTASPHPRTNNNHSLPPPIKDLSLSQEMLYNINSSQASPNLDQHQLHRTRPQPQVMAPIKLLIGVNSTVSMQSRRQEELYKATNTGNSEWSNEERTLSLARFRSRNPV